MRIHTSTEVTPQAGFAVKFALTTSAMNDGKNTAFKGSYLIKTIAKMTLLSTFFAVASCQSVPETDKIASQLTEVSATALLTEIADDYLHYSVQRDPLKAYFSDVPQERHDYLPLNDLKTLASDAAYVDALYQKLSTIPYESLTPGPDRTTWAIVNELMEISRARRVCRPELWQTVSSDSEGGWQTFRWLGGVQPLDNEALEVQALSRWGKIPHQIDVEISNLKVGLSQGYSMPKEIVRQTIQEVKSIVSGSIDGSPFMSLAGRSKNEAFKEQLRKVVQDEIHPAIRRYVEFLEGTYLDAAREEMSVLALPRGEECYAAFIRVNANRDISSAQVQTLGRKLVAENMKSVSALGSELYGTKEFSAIIENIIEDPSNKFSSKDELQDFLTQSVERSRRLSADWFVQIPDQELVITPLPEGAPAGAAFYRPGKPAQLFISLTDATKQRRGRIEVAAFHEGFPGHHLQMGLSKTSSLTEKHPVAKLGFFSSYLEGWGRYSEVLAEEMELYQTQQALISRRTWPARGMVLDTGVHLDGWSKEKTIAYIVASGAFDAGYAEKIYYRSAIVPGQLTAYDLGGQEILSLRRLAEDRLGENFDIVEFHQELLKNGPLPWKYLRINIEAWLESTPAFNTKQKNE